VILFFSSSKLQDFCDYSVGFWSQRSDMTEMSAMTIAKTAKY
jgi:hypothetical protein